MATIVYLDVEDEITTAAARIRSAGEPRVGLVIPFGSRVATSRINFRLLAREAQDARRRLDIVAPDASSRALAASAGLAVFGSVAEYEAALASGEAEARVNPAPVPATANAGRGAVAQPAPGATSPDARGAAVAAGAAGALRNQQPDTRDRRADEAKPRGRPAHARPAAEVEAESEAAAIAASSRSAGAASQRYADDDAPPRHRGRGAGLLVLVLALVVVLAGGGVVAAAALPSADVTVTPVLESIAPVSLTVRADTSATAVDPSGPVIPATAVSVPVTAQGDFPATAVSVQQTAASGSVTFDSINTVNAMPIPRGTRVSTSDGIIFATTESVTVPRATVPGGGSTITHGTASVGVTALGQGPKGNVPAGAIDQVPSSLAAQQISVSNAAPTSGGTRTELPKIAPEDVTAATAKLGKDLQTQLTTALADPSLAPQGTTLFPDTVRLGAPSFTPDAAGLAGKVLKSGPGTFTLQANATATVTAVDESPLQSIGENAVRAAVTPGEQLVDGSIQVTVGEGTVGEDGTVSYPVSGTGLQRRPIDVAVLKHAVLGKTEADAAAALAPYGRVSVTLWPFWVNAIPDNQDRVTVTVSTPVPPAATPTPPPTPTPRPTKPPATPKPSPSGPVGTAASASPVPSS